MHEMPHIAVLDTGYTTYRLEEELFRKNGFSLKIYRGDPADREAKIEFAQEATGILIRWTVIDACFLDRMKNLRAIVRYGVGYDNISLDEAGKRGIRVSNVRDYAGECVSDHALALIYSCIRGLPAGEKIIHRNFGKPPRQDIFELHDKTLGIIGLGRIGSRLAGKANRLFSRVLAVDPYVDDEKFTNSGARKTNLDSLLQNSHVISLHCNLTHETRNMINRQAFLKMSLRPVVINTARGPVINEDELLEALEKDLVHSAGLDVYHNEPLAKKQLALTGHPRVTSTGHYAWYSDASMHELHKRAAGNMIRLLQGKETGDRLV